MGDTIKEIINEKEDVEEKPNRFKDPVGYYLWKLKNKQKNLKK